MHLLGAPTLLGMLVEACLAVGARRAEPGEFTARAFLAGAFDLSQVHGIAGMVAARSDMQLQAAERLLHGALSETALRARETLGDLLSLVEGALDFADEPIEFISPADLRARLGEVHAALKSTIAAGFRAERWGRLPIVLLIGPPNAGKSSLLNRLTGMDRAICAPVAGTTRDVLSAPLTLDEADCLLVDAAGAGQTEAEVDAKAQAAARRAVKDADVLILVVDASVSEPVARLPDDVPPGLPIIVAANKSDLLSDDRQAAAGGHLAGASVDCVCQTSAVTGEGCDALKRAISRLLRDRPAQVGDGAVALMAEHREALEKALNALQRATDLASESAGDLENGELVAAELRIASGALGTLVGKDQTEDLLGRIFARFCVGK